MSSHQNGVVEANVEQWVKEIASHVRPQNIHWCTGSDEEYETLVKEMVKKGDLLVMNPQSYPQCYLHRSAPNDVARTEHLTFVCTEKKEDAGPNNNWMSPQEGHTKVDDLFKNSMQGRTLYVVPYCMGPLSSPYSRCGVEITDSPYVVVNMKKMTRMGDQALERIKKENKAFVKGLHCTGDLSIERRMIVHFPEELTIKSIGSGYGGNALLGKKCHALRIASFQAQKEGWLAEHMLILGLQSPKGDTTYIAAAFPSACGKTNLAMLIPPQEYQGWKIWTVGDDIAWIHVGADGQFYAINPEAGFFGVVPGTSPKTNPNALAMLNRDTIFTNVAVTSENEPWWEGKDDGKKPAFDWQGRPYTQGAGPAAHPNSRFTVSAKACPSYSSQAENPEGVPISAFIFGGRRPGLVPLVYEALNWRHGVLIGASVGSQTTAAATGEVGVMRRDSMAMKPFCGYNFADYFSHWLSFSKKTDHLPKVFHVNWFRQDEAGKFIWPGFGDNMRVLEWIVGRVKGTAQAKRTPIGYVPSEGAINLRGSEVTADKMAALTTINSQGFQKEMVAVGEYLESFGERVHPDLWAEQKRIVEELRG